MTNNADLTIRSLGLRDYSSVWEAMQTFTAARTETTADELWLLEHTPVFTLGYNSKPEHLKLPGDIPVIQTDRGGQVTYHGPGQIVAYVLLDLQRRSWGVRQLVDTLQQAVISLLATYGITGATRREAPGVYVDGAKIAAIGLRVRHGRCYHGLSLNVAMDLEPFQRINPCGYPSMQVTQLRDLGIATDICETRNSISVLIAQALTQDHIT
ncbi:MAG: lipoyl(octanoyl) transferase LipB [Gammaproteobacteria bacterium]